MSERPAQRWGPPLLSLAPLALATLLPGDSWAGACAGILAFALASFGAGRPVLAVLPPLGSPFLRSALGALLGWGLLGSVLALAGGLGHLEPWLLALILALPTPAAWGLVAPSVLPVRRAWRYWPPSVWATVGLIVLSSVLMAAAVTRPPRSDASLETDGALARQWALSGEIWGREGLHVSLEPSLTQTWRAVAWVLGGWRLAGLTGLWELALVALATAVLVRGVLGKGWAAALLACLFVLALPLLPLTVAEGSGGPVAAAFGLAAVWALLRAGDPELMDEQRAWAAVAGLLLGLALACGWGAWPLIPALGLVGLVHRPGREPTATTLGQLLLMAFVTLFPLAPWLARALFLTGDPLYPHLLGGPGWDETSAALLGRRAVDGFSWPETLLGGGGSTAVLGPLILLLVPLALAAPFLGERAVALAAAAGVLAAAWSLGAPRPVWLVAVFALLAALAAVTAARIRRRWPPLGKALLGLLLAATALQAWPLYRSLTVSRLGLFPTPTAVLETRSPALARLASATSRLPADARILLVGETRAGVLDRPAVWSTRIQPSPVTELFREAESLGGGEPELGLRAALRRREITHILVSPRRNLWLDRRPWDHFRERRAGAWTSLFRHLAAPRQIWVDPRTGTTLWDVRPPSLEGLGVEGPPPLEPSPTEDSPR